MSVLLETSVGNLTIDLCFEDAPVACANFLNLCKLKYYNGCLFFNVQHDYVVQTGDPTGTGRGGSCAQGLVYGDQARFLPDEHTASLRHDALGTVSFVRLGETPNTIGSQFIITTRPDCSGLDDHATVFARVVAGQDTALAAINGAYCDAKGRPFADIRIRHTYILVDPFASASGGGGGGGDPTSASTAAALAAMVPPASPRRSKPAEEVVPERLTIEEAADAEAAAAAAAVAHGPGASGSGAAAALDAQLKERLAAADAHAKAVTLEILGDLPSADVAPPENVLFVCKLNPVTRG